MNYIDQTDLIFEELFGSHPAQIDRIAEGVMNEKYKVEFDGKYYLIRFYLIDGDKKLRYEPAIINRLRKEGAKVPEVLNTSLELRNSYGKFIIYKWIQGESVSSFLKANELYNPILFAREIVENLKIISNLKIAGFGELESENSARYHSFKSFLIDKIKNGIKDLKGSEFSNFYNISKIESFLNRFLSNDFVIDIRPNLIWSDMSFDNMIISNQILQSFIDFEYLYSGDSKMTLGYFYGKCGNLELALDIIKHFKSDSHLGEAFEESLVFYSLLRFIILSRYSATTLPDGSSRKDFFEVFPGIKKSLAEFNS